ncbi:hypothetical protein, partial [Nocardia sp. NPDC052316]|uniref:hypothetical protein n=1 Tax=Nocardia sp. NPDC052316 TaxID=3364329 RepID=UPI0037C9737B
MTVLTLVANRVDWRRQYPPPTRVEAGAATPGLHGRLTPTVVTQHTAASVARMSEQESEGAMFERFTDRARRVVVLAQEEARMLNHNYIGTE